MADVRNDASGARRRRRRVRVRPGASRAVAASPPGIPAPAAAPAPPARRMSAEERAYRAARRRANRKISVLIHLLLYASVLLLIFVTAGFRPALVVALAWGVGLLLHWFLFLAVPDLRRRMVEREVEQRVSASVSRQRRDLEDRHARSLEELSASIAHEIRNPITAAKSLVQQMGEDPAAHENVEYAQVALEELQRVERSVTHLLRYARDEALEPRPLVLADVVDSALETLRERIAGGGVQLEREVDPDVRLQGDPEKLRRVVINLVGNALDAFAAAGTPEPCLAVSAGQNLAGTEAWLRVRDNGPGIDPERLPRVFKPFYTSKRDGTGLGLALARKVVDAHGGSIELHSEPGRGCDFVITLPRSRTRDAKGGAS